jgi:hypothetical protein
MFPGLLLAISLPCFAADDFKVIELEQDVIELERRVEELSRQLAQLEQRGTASTAAAEVSRCAGLFAGVAPRGQLGTRAAWHG